MKLKKTFWEMIYNSLEVLALYDFLRKTFRMCTNRKNYVPVHRWFDDKVEEEQWGYGVRDDMMA